MLLLRADIILHRWRTGLPALRKIDRDRHRVVGLGHIGSLLLLLNCAYSNASKRNTYTSSKRKSDACAANELRQTRNLLSRRDERRGKSLIFILKKFDAGLQLRKPGLLALTTLEGG